MSAPELASPRERLSWRIGLFLLIVASAWINLWRLAAGARSEYYAAIAVSMSKSFSNFLFGALDPAGTVSLDKIPGSYWLPAIFVKIFGFSNWAVDAPNALAGIAAAVVVAFAVRRLFGSYAGLFAGALIATTPIIAAASRSNQPQMFFVLAMAIAAERASAALTTGNRRTLIWAGVWIGLAFQTYMLEAWALWPALIIAWLIFAPVPRAERFKSLIIAGVTSLAVSLTWIIIVSVTPATARPYVGGTYRNNAWEMVFGYNGLGRFGTTQSLSSATDNPIYRSFTPPFSGTPSITRLFNDQLSGQIAWLIPLTILVIIIGLVATFKFKDFSSDKANFIFFTLWFVTFFLMFSKVAGMHQFYTTTLAIPMVVLVAGVFKYLIDKRTWLAKILLVLFVSTSAIWALFVSSKYRGFYTWAPKVALGLALLGAIGWLVISHARVRTLALASIVASVMITPTVWALDVINQPSTINPTAGPATANGFGGPGGGGFNAMAPKNGAPMQNSMGVPAGAPPNFDPRSFQDPGQHDRFANGNPPIGIQGGIGFGGGFGQDANTSLIKYLKANRNGSKFLLATFGGMAAAPFITATEDKVLPVGGFDGQDPSPTLAKFKELIKNGELKYVLIGGAGGNNNGNEVNTSKIQSWVVTNCLVDAGAPSGVTLYSCSPEVAVNN